MSKITLHIIRFNEHCLDFLRVAQPAFAKVVAPWGHDTMKLAEAKRLSPNTEWICRLYRDEQSLNWPANDAGVHAGLMHPYWDFYDIFESYNEPPPFGVEDWKRINEFEYQFARIVHEKGKKNVAFNWSNGQPPYEAWWHCQDAAREADYIGIHSYGWPFLSTNEGFALRHRAIPRMNRPILITEFGFTNIVIGGPDVGYYTWDIAPWAAKEYKAIQELAWFADRLQEDPYVLAACYFTTGRLPGDPWGTHDWTPKIYRAMAGYTPQTQPKEEEPKMDVWKNVPLNIAHWRPLIEKVTSAFHVPIPDYKGIPVSPAKVITCIIRIESNGDAKAVGGAGHAQGLMQVWKDHYPGLDLFNPEVNIRTGLAILKAKLDIAKGNLQDALYYYSGGTAWGSKEGYLSTYWIPFISFYNQFWGINLEPNAPPEIDHIQEAMKEVQALKAAHQVMGGKIEKIEEHLLEAERR